MASSFNSREWGVQFDHVKRTLQSKRMQGHLLTPAELKSYNEKLAQFDQQLAIMKARPMEYEM